MIRTHRTIDRCRSSYFPEDEYLPSPAMEGNLSDLRHGAYAGNLARTAPRMRSVSTRPDPLVPPEQPAPSDRKLPYIAVEIVDSPLPPFKSCADLGRHLGVTRGAVRQALLTGYRVAGVRVRKVAA